MMRASRRSLLTVLLQVLVAFLTSGTSTHNSNNVALAMGPPAEVKLADDQQQQQQQQVELDMNGDPIGQQQQRQPEQQQQQPEPCDCRSELAQASQQWAQQQDEQTKAWQQRLTVKDAELEHFRQIMVDQQGQLDTKCAQDKATLEDALKKTKVKAASLQSELTKAQARIQELSSVSFAKQLHKEVNDLWGQLTDAVKGVSSSFPGSGNGKENPEVNESEEKK